MYGQNVTLKKKNQANCTKLLYDPQFPDSDFNLLSLTPKNLSGTFVIPEKNTVLLIKDSNQIDRLLKNRFLIKFI